MLTKKFLKTKDECEVTFEVSVANADQVVLVSEHNGWEPIAMKQVKDGPFRAKVRLPKDGRFQFRYLVNGSEWHNDEAADAYLANEHGSENSVIFTAN
jgi:1,4-alpha-glucan branching enzyme